MPSDKVTVRFDPGSVTVRISGERSRYAYSDNVYIAWACFRIKQSTLEACMPQMEKWEREQEKVKQEKSITAKYENWDMSNEGRDSLT
jgi:hypothetical protein